MALLSWPPKKRQTADEHPVADGNGVAMVWNAVCSGGNAWRQLRLGCSVAVCPEAFFLSERRFAPAPRARCFLHDRVIAEPTYFFTEKPTYLTRVSSGCCVLTGQVAWRTGLLEKRQVAGAQAPSGKEPGGDEPEDRSQEEGSEEVGIQEVERRRKQLCNRTGRTRTCFWSCQGGRRVDRSWPAASVGGSHVCSCSEENTDCAHAPRQNVWMVVCVTTRQGDSE